MSPYPLYHNTTSLSGDPLDEAVRYKKSLHRILTELFKSGPSTWFSPHEAMDICAAMGCQHDINTYRAAFTKMERDDFLTKSDRAEATTPKGQPCHRWKLRLLEGQGRLF